MPLTLGLLAEMAECAYRFDISIPKPGPSSLFQYLGNRCSLNSSAKSKPTDDDSRLEGHLKKITPAGYRLDKVSSRSPRDPGLGCAVFVPAQPDPDDAPIVIAFRGTKNGADITRDLTVLFRGIMGNTERRQAYQFYKNIRQNHPNKKIVLTGHSLGGHIAQYVAAKAASKTADRNFAVRTFNSALVITKHSKAFAKNPCLHHQIINYRTTGDVVSGFTRYGNRYGSRITLSHNEKGMGATHSLDCPRDALRQAGLAEIPLGDVGSLEWMQENLLALHYRSLAKNLVPGQIFGFVKPGLGMGDTAIEDIKQFCDTYFSIPPEHRGQYINRLQIGQRTSSSNPQLSVFIEKLIAIFSVCNNLLNQPEMANSAGRELRRLSLL